MSTVDADNLLSGVLLVGFTGHRKLDDPRKVADAIGRALDGLATRHPRLAGIASAASGGDTLFAEAMLGRGYPLRVVLPFPRQRFQQDFAGDPDGWSRVVKILARASAIDVIDAQQSDNHAYMEVGSRCIDAADVVLVVWDGQPAKGFGGTADAVRYARKIGKPAIVIDPATGTVIDDIQGGGSNPG